jgi:hypothetical protein
MKWLYSFRVLRSMLTRPIRANKAKPQATIITPRTLGFHRGERHGKNSGMIGAGGVGLPASGGQSFTTTHWSVVL